MKEQLIPHISRYFSEKSDFQCAHGVPFDSECGECSNALKTQVGGNHYTKLKVQPMEYSMANNLDACQHTIIKYVTRFRDKNGIEDLKKAKHVIDMLIAFEEKRMVP